MPAGLAGVEFRTQAIDYGDYLVGLLCSPTNMNTNNGRRRKNSLSVRQSKGHVPTVSSAFGRMKLGTRMS
jgi:hypothetical protein